MVRRRVPARHVLFDEVCRGRPHLRRFGEEDAPYPFPVRRLYRKPAAGPPKEYEDMGVFQKIGNALTRFMYGRNGVDQLNQAALWLYLILCVVRMIAAAAFKSAMAVRVLDFFTLFLSIVILFRMFSKNLPRRRGENQAWLSVKSRWAGARSRRADKTHKYFTCKNCGTICRVPAGKGRIEITCPKCGEKIQAKT